jgi:hypothetical protein
MKPAKKFFLALAAAIGGLAFVFVASLALFFYSMVSTVMIKRSPDGKHFAKLIRVDGIDLMFNVSVDGKHVYQSPDFAPTKAECREHIAWAADGKAVVLFVAGQRLFGYEVKERRSLTDGELARISFPQISDLGFEGTLPSADDVK